MPRAQERENLAALEAAQEKKGVALPRGLVTKFTQSTTRPGEVDWVTEMQEVAEAMQKAGARTPGADGKVTYPRGEEQKDKMARAMTYMVGSGPEGGSAIKEISCTRIGGDSKPARWFTYGGLLQDMETRLSGEDQEKIGGVPGLKDALVRLGARGFITLYSERILLLHV